MLTPWATPSSLAVRVIDCAGSGVLNNSSAITLVGSNATNVNTNGWTYDNYTANITANYAFTTSGHMKNLDNRTSTNTLFNTYQESD